MSSTLSTSPYTSEQLLHGAQDQLGLQACREAIPQPISHLSPLGFFILQPSTPNLESTRRPEKF